MSENPLSAYLPLHLMIVDDDPFLAELAADHYRGIGCTVELAADGAEALAAMDRRRPDIVLCDRRMPNMTGSELLEKLRGRGPDWQQIVFVFVTGLTDRRDRYAMLDLHPDGYLCKPIDFEREDAALAAILARKRAVAGEAFRPPTPA